MCSWLQSSHYAKHYYFAWMESRRIRSFFSLAFNQHHSYKYMRHFVCHPIDSAFPHDIFLPHTQTHTHKVEIRNCFNSIAITNAANDFLYGKNHQIIEKSQSFEIFLFFRNQKSNFDTKELDEPVFGKGGEL